AEHQAGPGGLCVLQRAGVEGGAVRGGDLRGVPAGHPRGARGHPDPAEPVPLGAAGAAHLHLPGRDLLPADPGARGALRGRAGRRRGVRLMTEGRGGGRRRRRRGAGTWWRQDWVPLQQ
ncbi:unnamed protein product, partial [Heterosigma akashiwo]